MTGLLTVLLGEESHDDDYADYLSELTLMSLEKLGKEEENVEEEARRLRKAREEVTGGALFIIIIILLECCFILVGWEFGS